MQDIMSVGPVPPHEECSQVGEPDYAAKAQAECKRYISKLREFFGDEPDGTRLAVKRAPHEFGSYYEVVCYFNGNDKASLDYAFACEGFGPCSWDERPTCDECQKIASPLKVRESVHLCAECYQKH